MRKKGAQGVDRFFSRLFSRRRCPFLGGGTIGGTLTFDEVLDELSRSKGCDRAVAEDYLREALDRQGGGSADCGVDPRPETGRIPALRALETCRGEFIDFLRRTEIYGCFDGEVVSCEEGVVKPEPRIYEILLDRFGLDPAETLFIDDRRSNLEAAAAFGIATFHFREPESSCTQLREMLLQKE